MALDPRQTYTQYPIKFREVEAVGDLPDPNGSGITAGMVIWVRTPGSMYLCVITDAAGNPHQWVNIGPSVVPPATDWLLMYLVDNRATGAAAPFTTPVAGRGPFPTVPAAIAQLTADRATLGADYPAVIQLVEGGDYPLAVNLPHNVALVSAQQEEGAITTISGLVTVSPASDGAVTISGVRCTGGVLLGGASAIEFQASKCLLGNGPGIGLDVTNTNVGTGVFLQETDVASGAVESIRSVRNVTARNVTALGNVDLSVGAGVSLFGTSFSLTGRLLLPAGTNSTLLASRIDASGAAGTECVLMAGGDILLEQCSFNAKSKACIAATAPSTATFADLQTIDPTDILGANMTHNPIPGVRSNVVVSIGGGLPYNILPYMDVLQVTGGAPGVVNLPAISSLQQGRVLMIRNDDPGAPASPLAPLTVTANAADTINLGALGGSITLPNDTGILLVADRSSNNWILLGQAAGSVLPAGTLRYLVANQAPLGTPGTYANLDDALTDAAADGTSNAPIYMTSGTYAVSAVVLAAGQGRQIIGMCEDPGAVQVNFAGGGGGAFISVTGGVRLGLKNVSVTVSTNDDLISVSNAAAIVEMDRVVFRNTANGDNIIVASAISELQIRRSSLTNTGAGSKAVIDVPAGSTTVVEDSQLVAASAAQIAARLRGSVTLRDTGVTGRANISDGTTTALDVTFNGLGGAAPPITMSGGSTLIAQDCTGYRDAGQLLVQATGPATLRLIGYGFNDVTSAATTLGPYDTIANGLTVTQTIRAQGLEQQDLAPVSGGPVLTINATTEYARVTPGAGIPNAQIQVPLAVNYPNGYRLRIKNASSANSVDVLPAGAETLDGLLAVTVAAKNWLVLVAQRTGTWDILS